MFLKDPETKPSICGQLILDKSSKTTEWEKSTTLFNKWYWAAVAVHTYNPRYLGGKGRRIESW
jgi:hypothetical protein